MKFQTYAWRVALVASIIIAAFNPHYTITMVLICLAIVAMVKLDAIPDKNDLDLVSEEELVALIGPD